jgi:hypothetical protein
MPKREREREIERKVAEGRPRFAEDVKAGMARFGGQSRSDLEPDHQRGASSPLGASTQFVKQPLQAGKGYEPKSMGPTGVPGKYNAATQGPGSGRTVHPSGSQSTYGKVNPGEPRQAPRDILSEFGPERSK